MTPKASPSRSRSERVVKSREREVAPRASRSHVTRVAVKTHVSSRERTVTRERAVPRKHVAVREREVTPAPQEHAAVAKTENARPETESVSSVRRGQGINSTRAREIQEALIRERYMDGEPTGVWDQSTRDAMMHFQSANGWQTKVVPDSRALIKLGLGPNHANLINPASFYRSDARVMSPVVGSISPR